jgi:hypothetical protein
MMRKSLALVFAVAALSLGSCAENFNARVSRFQALPPPNGESFVVVSSNPRLQGGLEFGQYAQLVAAQLVEKGYHPANDGARPDLIVKMAYSVDRGQQKIQSTGFSGFGGLGGYGPYGGFGRFYGGFGYHPYIYGFYDPFLTGGYNDITSYTIYTSELDLQIERAGDKQRVFEGTAKAVSSDDDLPHLVPNLITAMFTGFPGNSGETVKITIAPTPKSKS